MEGADTADDVLQSESLCRLIRRIAGKIQKSEGNQPARSRLVEGRRTGPGLPEEAGTEGLQNLLEPLLQAFRFGEAEGQQPISILARQG